MTPTVNVSNIMLCILLLICGLFHITSGQSSYQGSDLIQRIKDHVNVTMSPYIYKGMNASLAIDGDTRTNPKTCACCATSNGENQKLNWWHIDLGKMYPIKLVQFIGRDNERNFNQFKGFNLSFSNTSAKTGDVFYTNNANGFKFDIPVPNTLVRHIHISKLNTLTICEVKVFEGDCITGRFGDECGNECHCKDNLPCNRTTGICRNSECKIGWTGYACDADCITGRFGDECSKECHCKDNLPCNRTTGMCRNSECKIGWTGYACDADCITGRFGDECSKECHCKDNLPCNRTTGMCRNSECKIGWTGYACDADQDLIQRIKDNVTVRMSPHVYNGMNASLAIDGDNRTNPDKCNCCFASFVIGRILLWWEIDLGMMYPIKLIQFIGRNDGDNEYQSKGFKLTLSNTLSTDVDVFYTINETLPGYKFDIPVPNTLVRHINISKWAVLAICEVKVFEGVCRIGNFGDECVKECNCDDDLPCNRSTGMCQHPGCHIGWQGVACDAACSNNKFGQNCSQRCHCKDDTQCNMFTGDCKDGLCAPGYDGRNCSMECSNNTFGENCLNRCHCKDDTLCDIFAGNCTSDICATGFKGRNCSIGCSDKTFGENCLGQCHCVDDTVCDIYAGNCTNDKCTSGFGGNNCSIECQAGKFGENCANPCNCNNGSCDRFLGKCPGDLCSAGYYGSNCSIECSDNKFGENCLNPCHCKHNDQCGIYTGNCTNDECADEFTGYNCSVAFIKHEEEGDNIGWVVAIVFAIIIVAIIVLAVYLSSKRKTTKANEDKLIVENANVKRKPYVRSDLRRKLSVKQNNNANTVENEYYNETLRNVSITVPKLWDYVHNHIQNGSTVLYNEFKLLPAGLRFPHAIAKLPKNKPKNRYKDMIVYDHSRVILTPTSPDEKDYINACFVDGYDKKKKFIASQGPADNMVDDFWRMVWQQRSTAVVMLTNTVENNVLKCMLYWPDEGEKQYGKATLKSITKMSTPDYTIRSFEIAMPNEEPRKVVQYHYTSWPDKHVPNNTYALVNFWRAIENARTPECGPIVVHCSAGVGRTGTYISLDNLFYQAQKEGIVQPLKIVGELREQRVNMVQTRVQYVYLHEAVADALLIGTHFVWARQFEHLYNYLTDTTTADIPKLQHQYQLIEQSFEDTADPNPESEYVNTQTILSEIDAYRPSNKRVTLIDRQGPLFLPTYKNKDAFLITSCLSDSSPDQFWEKVIQHKVKTIVSINDSEDDNEIKRCSEAVLFTVYISQEVKGDVFKEKTINVKKTNESETEEIKIKHFEFNQWKSNTTVPENSQCVIDLVDAIQLWHPMVSDEESVLLYSGNGLDRCGVVCVLLNELQRMKQENGKLNILESVKMMKERERHIMISYEQYKYCHDVILASIKQSYDDDDVYQNV